MHSFEYECARSIDAIEFNVRRMLIKYGGETLSSKTLRLALKFETDPLIGDFIGFSRR